MHSYLNFKKSKKFQFLFSTALSLCLTAGFANAQDLPGQVIIPDSEKTSYTSVSKEIKSDNIFIMSSFMATSQNTLSIFTSNDGKTYTSLASENYTPPANLLRDPSLIRGEDGFYYIVYTTNWDGKTFGVAKSSNLRDWTHLKDVTLPIDNLTNVWAPEWFKDDNGKTYIIVSLSKNGTKGPFGAYKLELLDNSYTKFSNPEPLKGLQNNFIDTFIVKNNNKYYAFTKNETTKDVELATSDKLDGDWVFEKTGDWAGWGNWIEGQSLVQLDDKTWRIYFDDYRNKKYYYSDSTDNFKTWTPKQEIGGVSGTVRHFTVLKETTKQFEAVTKPKAPPATISFDKYSLMINGKREMFFAGEMHPFRLPSPDLWRDILQKMKRSGLNTVSFYFDWGYHSAKPGHYDFTGIRNVEKALEMAKEEGLYVIARMGPYVNAELSGGGYPGWMFRNRAEARTDAKDYKEASDEWMTQINAIIKRHQITNGTGNVILYQLENELGRLEPQNIRYMNHLREKAIKDGITVPLFHNAASRRPDWTPKNSTAPFANPGPTDIYAFDGYPGGTCLVDGTTGVPNRAPDWGIYGTNIPRVGSLASPNTPGFVAEIGAGWFDYWGSNGTYECTAKRQGAGYTRLFYGKNLINRISIHNAYMMFGGTSWGWLPGPMVYTSYDYGAPISEARIMRDKAFVMKQLGDFIQAATPVLSKMDKGDPIKASNENIQIYHNVNNEKQTHIYFVNHAQSDKTHREDFNFNITTKDGRFTLPSEGNMTINGQDGKTLLAAYEFERQYLVYSTSEIQTHFSHSNRDIALFYGRAGETGETALKYNSMPKIEILEGNAKHKFKDGILTLSYDHKQTNKVKITGGGRPELLLIITTDLVGQDYTIVKNKDKILTKSKAFVRDAILKNDILEITGDIKDKTNIEFYTDKNIKGVKFNNETIAFTKSKDGSFKTADIRGAEKIILPDLMGLNWKRRFDSLESKPDFDDSKWLKADLKSSSAGIATQFDRGQPVLTMSDYGFHHGDVWYRGKFKVTDNATQNLDLFWGGGGAGLIQVWIDGKFIGQQEHDTGRPFPETTDNFKIKLPDLKPGEHTISVMVRNNSHNWNLFADDQHKEGRGLVAASLSSNGIKRFQTPIDWKIQGNKGGEDIADLVRGPHNNGGLYGEREGWHLPVNKELDANWEKTKPDAAPIAAGTHWLKTNFKLDLPKDHDVQLGLGFGDINVPRSINENRVLIFINGWNMGQFISHIGPQRVFIIPPGIINHNGDNTIALAVTSDGKENNSLEKIQLLNLNSVRGGVKIEPVPQPKNLQR